MTGSVSVIVPVYNGANLIADALRSAHGQTFQPKEVIVVDDGSTDGTEAIVRRFETTTFLRQPRQGAAEARNTGARLATGSYLAFLDADDLWPETRLAQQVHALMDAPNLDFVSGSMVQFKPSAAGQIVPLSPPTPSRLPSVLLIRREAFWKVGAFSSQWEVGETIEWWSRAIDAGLRGDALPEVALFRRVHAHNLGKTAIAPTQSYLRMLHAVVNRRRDSNESS
jgi:glycosyltransferase involved in cell wall biosynthesis